MTTPNHAAIFCCNQKFHRNTDSSTVMVWGIRNSKSAFSARPWMTILVLSMSPWYNIFWGIHLAFRNEKKAIDHRLSAAMHVEKVFKHMSRFNCSFHVILNACTKAKQMDW